MNAKPNLAHKALADLEAIGVVKGIITQNVDGLHQKAGSKIVIDLHGRNDRVVCLSCKDKQMREIYQNELESINDEFSAKVNHYFANKKYINNNQDSKVINIEKRPDGDAELGTMDYSQVAHIQ